MNKMADDKSTSQFNEGQLQIIRWHNIKNRCHEYRTHGELAQYGTELDGLWIEMSADAVKLDGKDEGKNKYFTETEEYQKKLGALYKIIAMEEKRKKNTSVFRSLLNKDKGNPLKNIDGQLYELLTKRERWLRNLQEDAGKGGVKENKDKREFD